MIYNLSLYKSFAISQLFSDIVELAPRSYKKYNQHYNYRPSIFKRKFSIALQKIIF